MTEEEYAIINFLQANPETWFARKEIARKAVKRRVYEADQNWANNALTALVTRKQIEQNDSGYYKLNKS